jgi:hypothetical protein
MRTYIGVLILGSVLIPASFSLAQPYGYVTTDGSVEVEVANDPSEAIVSAPERLTSSGVVEVNEAEAVALASVDNDTEIYAYVSASGSIGVTVAETPEEAIVHAENRMFNSGVVLVME